MKLAQTILQFPQTGLALMGFSRYGPSSLDLLHFVVREQPRSRRGATAEPSRRMLWLSMADSLDIWESGNPGIWKSGNLESQKIGKIEIIRMQILSAQNVGKVWISRKKSSWPHLVPFQVFFPWTGKMQKMYRFCIFSLVGQWALFTWFGAKNREESQCN